MKVHELLEQLEGVNPDLEVCIVYQPNYPLQAYTGDDIAVTSDKVYIGETPYGGSDYITGDVREKLGY